MYEIRGARRRYATRVISPSPQAVIFDFDGTLVDSEPVHALATGAGLALAGIELSVEEFLARWVGLPDVDCYSQVARDRGRLLDAATLARVRIAKNETYERVALEGRVPLCEGAAGLVEDLARDMPLGVCSAARRIEIEAALERHGLRRRFRSIVAVEDVRVSKPDPEGYLKSAASLGVDPGACVALEDTPRGIEAALGAGIAVVGIAQTVSPDRLGGASLVVPRLAEVTRATLAEALDRHRRGAASAS